MAVEDVRQFLDLLTLSPEVTELSVCSASGNKLTIKRQSAPTALPATSRSEEFGAMDAAPVEQSEAPTVSAGVSIKATMVGLFHDANPALANGSSIVSGQIVGYIESMRLMNEVVSTVEGTVDVVIATEGQPVEYGQPLFALTSN